ncbi:MAG: tagaturonate reductase [Gemmatimonadetes bacterium]|nr:tagaturonate reductase [Gemmatimonadota bacterium]
MSDALPTLNRELALSPEFQARTDLASPVPATLDLPERVVQFGTGALLRGFVEYFLDAANRQGLFDGRVVMVGSTGSGRDEVVNDQDGLYTLTIRGVEGGEVREERRVIASVSRALSAKDEWGEVLACARKPELELVFSNTTEIGIVLDEGDSAEMEPPRSFPGKLTRFLYERARAFDFDPARGVVVIPCELIEDNGGRLRAIVLQLAERWELDDRFRAWVEAAVPFCDTLVDRIVPGTPDADTLAGMHESLGYRDDLLTTSEVYRLFAIEGDDALRARLRFADADPGIVVTPDVGPYRERKVRLLNGSHSITVPAALLCGCETVLEAVEHPLVGPFLRRVMLEEIVPGLEVPGAEAFAHEVLDRFANPFIRHALIDISLQQTMKVRVRIVPSILRYAERNGRAPASLAFGFAAFLLLARGEFQDRRRAAGLPVPADEQGDRLRAYWGTVHGRDAAALEGLVREVCADTALWGTDLTEVPGFVEAVAGCLARMERDGVPAALEAHLDEVSAPAA